MTADQPTAEVGETRRVRAGTGSWLLSTIMVMVHVAWFSNMMSRLGR